MFRFSIRDVLWLTVVVALAVAWGLDHWSAARSRERDAALLEEARQRALMEREMAELARLQAILQQAEIPQLKPAVE
jgi:hypothetical protein